MISPRSRELLKAVGWRVAPKCMPRVMEWRSSWMAQRNGSLRVREMVWKASGGTIRGGPFRGMRYLSQSVGSVLAAKLVGSYEEELHAVIEAVCDQEYERVYDVGCAEGYYAVGLARRLPGSPRVVAYDTDPYARLLCAELAALNSVELDIKGFCGPPEIAALRGKRGLVVCDCEGYEFVLLFGSAPANLADSDLIVELHGPADDLLNAFADTHHVQVLTHRPREAGHYSLLTQLNETERQIALAEGRGGPTPWAFMRSKARWISRLARTEDP